MLTIIIHLQELLWFLDLYKSTSLCTSEGHCQARFWWNDGSWEDKPQHDEDSKDGHLLYVLWWLLIRIWWISTFTKAMAMAPRLKTTPQYQSRNYSEYQPNTEKDASISTWSQIYLCEHFKYNQSLSAMQCCIFSTVHSHNKRPCFQILLKLRNSASSFHWLSSCIFTVCLSSSRIGDTSSHPHYMMF